MPHTLASRATQASLALLLCVAPFTFALDSSTGHDPSLPAPSNAPGAADGLAVGSLISTAAIAIPANPETGQEAKIAVWGYRKNGHGGNYHWNGRNVGFENNSPSARKNQARISSVKDFNDPNHPLYGKTVTRLFTTAHTLYAMTSEGDVWSWGDSLHGTAGCIGTGFETGTGETGWDGLNNRFGDYAVVYNLYNVIRNGSIRSSVKGPHYQARPCPAFWSKHPNPSLRREITDIDGGEYNAIAKDVSGHVWSWGSDAFYQTVKSGTYYVRNKVTGKDVKIVIPAGDKGEPVDITGFFEGETVLLIGGAYEGQYAVTRDAEGKYSLWGWGRSFNRALNDKNNDNYVATPTKMPQYDALASRIKYVNGGYGWTAALLSDGSVWGSGLERHLGMGNGKAPDGRNTFQPVLIMGKDSVTGQDSGYPNVSRLVARYVGGVAQPEDDDEALYTWGWTGYNYTQVYGDRPTRHQLAGKLYSFGAVKEAVFYLTRERKLYGVGYGDQRVINLCDNLTVSYDRKRGKYVDKNSMNWYRAPGVPGGYEIPYRERLDVTGDDYCDGGASGFYSGKTLPGVRKWTGFDDGRDGAVPSNSGALLCQDAEEC